MSPIPQFCKNPVKMLGCLFVALIGGTVIFGHLFTNYEFETLHPSFVTMKVSTASSLIAAAAAILFRLSQNRAASQICSIFIVLIMAIGLSGYNEPTEEVMTVGAFVPSIGTAICFLCIILYQLSNQHTIFRLTSLALGVISIFGYIIDLPPLYWFIPDTSTAMAPHTAICFVILSLCEGDASE